MQTAANVALGEIMELQTQMQQVAGMKAANLNLPEAAKLFRKTNKILESVHKIASRAKPYMKAKTITTTDDGETGKGGRKAKAKVAKGKGKVKGKAKVPVKPKGKGKPKKPTNEATGKGKTCTGLRNLAKKRKMPDADGEALGFFAD